MGMEYEEVENKIKQALLGKTLVNIADGAGQNNTYFIRSLTGREDAIVTYAHQQAINYGIKSDLCTQKELEKEFASRGLWTHEEEIEIESLKNGINRLKNILPSYQYQKSKWHQINNRINKSQRELNVLESTKRQLFINSLEYRAQEVRYRKIAFFCLENLDEKPFWSEKEFENWTDFCFIFNVTEAYISAFVLDEKTVREIARSPSWRYRWLATKNGSDLFGKAACEWSQAQNALIYWSLYYDGIFEDPDCPQELINDDAALDNWLKQKNRERLRNRSNNNKDVYKSDRSKSGKKMSGGTEELFIFAERSDKKSIEKIQSMNDPGTRARLREEREKLAKEKGMVTEWNLRKGMYTKENS
jgi:hypothetical protein